jgi:hypothetical protein
MQQLIENFCRPLINPARSVDEPGHPEKQMSTGAARTTRALPRLHIAEPVIMMELLMNMELAAQKSSCLYTTVAHCSVPSVEPSFAVRR